PNFGDDVPILVAHPPPPLPKPRRRHAAAIAVSVMSPKKAKLGVFQHVTATYDGATARLYVDGLEVNSFQAAGAIPPGPGPLSAGTTARSTARCSRRTR
ncbi:MAG TPA: LamG-like jellyroll fold domain-containing protein, partial [Kofleriaceae bacterium]|nr:LamG-like jellyroll fold domain-containing protein [Kofleriaceae bacterium]